MKESLEQSICKLPIRARVSVALAAAEHIFDKLNGRKAYKLAQKAFGNAWKWASGKDVTAQRLYDQIHPLSNCQYDLRKNSAAMYSLLSAVYALYYVTWHARRREVSRKLRRPTLPNDMAEVTESVLLDTLRFAVKAARTKGLEEKWQLDIVQKLLADNGKFNPNKLGSSIPRSYFQLQ